MIPTMFDLRPHIMPDPNPPRYELDPMHRRVLVLRTHIRTPVQPVQQAFDIPGEAIPTLIQLLQQVVDKFPELTSERAEKEGVVEFLPEGEGIGAVAVDQEAKKMAEAGAIVVPGPGFERKQ